MKGSDGEGRSKAANVVKLLTERQRREMDDVRLRLGAIGRNRVNRLIRLQHRWQSA
jgi:hypothetical protein